MVSPLNNNSDTTEQMYYTYAYLREDGTPYYIGKGTRRRIHSKLHGIHLPPEKRRIFLKTGLTAEEATRHEIYLIAVFGRKDLGTGILRNLTDGGEGVPGRVVSQETREKLRRANTGYRHTPETLFRISKALKARIITKEHRQRINEALRNHNQSGDKNPNWGKRWWNNGIEEMMSIECPGEGFVIGRLYRKRINNS
jgi:hypothetical protein